MKLIYGRKDHITDELPSEYDNYEWPAIGEKDPTPEERAAMTAEADRLEKELDAYFANK